MEVEGNTQAELVTGELFRSDAYLFSLIIMGVLHAVKPARLPDFTFAVHGLCEFHSWDTALVSIYWSTSRYAE